MIIYFRGIIDEALSSHITKRMECQDCLTKPSNNHLLKGCSVRIAAGICNISGQLAGRMWTSTGVTGVIMLPRISEHGHRPISVVTHIHRYPSSTAALRSSQRLARPSPRSGARPNSSRYPRTYHGHATGFTICFLAWLSACQPQRCLGRHSLGRAQPVRMYCIGRTHHSAVPWAPGL
jgi:hypothetical protein